MELEMRKEAMEGVKAKQQKGVTLVEMAAVVGLLLILVAIGTVVWVSQTERALRNSVAHSTRDLITVMKIYRTDNGDYPPGTVLDPLYPYTNVTQLIKDYQSIAIERAGAAVCLDGLLKGIKNKYHVALCAETDDAGAVKYKTTSQPACCWEGTAPVDCTNAANWYPCKDKM